MPRITGIISPLVDFSKIPASILNKKADEGTEKHNRLELFFKRPKATYPPRSIENLMQGTLSALQTFHKAVCEETCIRGDLTGHPDVYTKDKQGNILWVGDYKFTYVLYDTTALQLVGYEYLLDADVPLYVFHFPTDDILITYQVNPAVKPILRDFFFRLYDNHERALADDFVKLDLRYDWDMIVANNDIWLPVGVNQVELSLTDIEQAERACMVLTALSELKDVEAHYKIELKRFLEENPDIPSVETEDAIFKIIQCKGRPKYKKLPPDVEARINRLKEPYRLEPEPYSFVKITEK